METISELLLSFLLNAVWQIPLITAVAFFCNWLLGKASARIRHSLWVAALILALGLPVFSVFDFPKSAFSDWQNVQKTNVGPRSDPVSSAAVVETPREGTSSAISIDRNLSAALIACYLLLLSCFLVKLFRAWRRTQIIKNKVSMVKPSEEISGIVEECRAFLGVKKVRVLYSSGVASPVTVGAFNPLLILPESLARETDRNTLLSAIGHELAHVKRRDYFLNFLYEFIYLPLSFHPLAAVLKRRIRETRELGCDELVTEKLLNPTVYAESLVRLARSAMVLSRPATISIGINDADILEYRIMRILKKPKITVFQRNLLLVAATVLFAAAFVLAKSFSVGPVITQQALIETEQTKTVEVGGEKAAERANDDKNDLSRRAKVSREKAIEIATGFQPGTVTQVEFGENDEGLIYKILIRNKDAAKGEVTRLTIDALDGRIIKAWRGIRK